MPDVILHLRNIEKVYGALRPLRLRELVLHAGESVALTGVDGPAAAVLVDLITGAVLPDQGEVVGFGAATAAPSDGDTWLASLERFGILSERAVLLEAMTVAQNLALPFSIALNPIPDTVMVEVLRLAAEVGCTASDVSLRVGDADPLMRARVRLARALATGPQLLLAEHPNALVSADQTAALGADLSRVTAARGIASLTITADNRFARSVASRVLRVDPASGVVTKVPAWAAWFGRG
jgi:ABC-type transporter Mla maintaining outer membrane lipid asymmetry ATPase subunit MlaF